MRTITFDQLVQHGKDAGGNIVNGMPWSFEFEGYHVTHENDNCYLVCRGSETHRFNRGELLCVGPEGVIAVSLGNGIGWAVKEMQGGARVRRAGWNGKGMFLFLVPGSTFKVNRPPLLGIYPEGTTVEYHAHVDMKTADGQIVPWLCSQTDLLATDWELV